MKLITIATDWLVVSVRHGKLIHVYAFDDNSESWLPKGEPINVQFSSESGDYGVSLSSNGNVIAISDEKYDNFSGRVTIFVYNTDKRWDQIGNDIVGENVGMRLGLCVEISADGTSLAIGAPFYDTIHDYDVGQVQGYKYSRKNDLWIKKGRILDGEAEGDGSGYSVSMSRDGSIVAIGAPRNDGNGINSGHVRVYKYINDNEKWKQLGEDIDGEASQDQSGESVAISGSGSTVAIGAPFSFNGNRTGYVRVYGFNHTNATWVQRGTDIDGEHEGDMFGFSVAMSDDGETIVVGAPCHDGNKKDTRHVLVFKYSTVDKDWVKQGAGFDGHKKNYIWVVLDQYRETGQSLALLVDSTRIET